MTTRAVVAFRIKPECIEQARALFAIQDGDVSERMGLTSNAVYVLDNVVVRIIEHDMTEEELSLRLAAGHQRLKEFEARLNEVLEQPRDLLSLEGVRDFQALATMEEVFSWRRQSQPPAPQTPVAVA